nr:elongator complex protein 6-like [Malus domestica]
MRPPVVSSKTASTLAPLSSSTTFSSALSLSLPTPRPNAVVFVAFAHPFSHYDRILRRLGCNLAAQRDNNRFFFLDMLMDCPDEGKNSDCGLIALYGKIQL